MHLLPFENIRYQSHLSYEEVLNRLQRIVKPVKSRKLAMLKGSKSLHIYQGKVISNTFYVRRILKYYNNFQPRISGRVRQTQKGTEVHVKMRPSTPVIIFMIFWMLFYLFALLLALSGAESLTDEPIIFILILMTGGYTLFTGAFKYESIQSKKYFAQLFEAQV